MWMYEQVDMMCMNIHMRYSSNEDVVLWNYMRSGFKKYYLCNLLFDILIWTGDDNEIKNMFGNVSKKIQKKNRLKFNMFCMF
jgi:hypothetical protein